MKKKNIKWIIIGVCAFIALAVASFLVITNWPSKDALRFKSEYESLNNTVRESDGAKYNNVSVPKRNPIKYIDCEEALDILDSKKAIIYVGADWCPWCRNAVPVLFDVAKDFGVSTIYYLNLDNEKSMYEIKDGKLVNKVRGSENYYKLLDKLKSRLSDYSLTDKEGKKYDTGEKRIYMPYVMAIRNGEVIEDHIGTTELDEGQDKYDAMTEAQEKELYNKYKNMFELVYKNEDHACDDNVCY